jgi:hypothetical protein
MKLGLGENKYILNIIIKSLGRLKIVAMKQIKETKSQLTYRRRQAL